MWQNRSLFTTVQYNSKMKCDKIEVYLPLFNTTAQNRSSIQQQDEMWQNRSLFTTVQ